MTTDVDRDSLARGVLDELRDEMIVLAVPGTDYKLHLSRVAPAAPIGTPVGKRITGTIRARALRVHAARAGGGFIEPVWGEPRIVQGVVLAVSGRRALIDAIVPMWVTLMEDQPADAVAVGRMVNFYVRSGTSFEPETR